VWLSGPIDVAEGRPRVHADFAGSWVHPDRVEPAEIEDDPAVDRAVARDVVPAAADRERQSRRLCNADGRSDVPDCPSAYDRGRAPVDQPIPDPTRFVVGRIRRQNDRAVETGTAQGVGYR